MNNDIKNLTNNPYISTNIRVITMIQIITANDLKTKGISILNEETSARRII